VPLINLVDEAPASVPYGADGYDPFIDLWSRLIRPFDVVHTVSAITGLSISVVSQMVGIAIAGSPQATHLLDTLPMTIRSLSTSMTSHAERCKGELRGPVLWSETMSARASSFGDSDLYVCMTPSRVYDVDENRVLVAALVAVRDAAQVACENTPLREQDNSTFLVLRRNGKDAGRFVEHPSLQRVSREYPKARAIKRTWAGKKRKIYEPALQMLDRAANPLSSADIRDWCDRRTVAQFRVLMGIAHRLERRSGTPLPDFRSERGSLWAGPLEYHHARLLGEPSSAGGIRIGNLLVDVPDPLGDPDRERAERHLSARPGVHDAMVVMSEGDLDVAVERALTSSP
jgi:hypothetical protein